MARLPRLSITGCPQHIIQRGNNCQACFFAERDYTVYLDKLCNPATRYNDFHSCIRTLVLMTHHVHLLITAPSNDGISQVIRVMRAIEILHYRHRTLCIWR
jgi:putative transposase